MPRWFDINRVIGPIRDQDRKWAQRLSDLATPDAWTIVWDGPLSRLPLAEQVLADAGFSFGVAPGRRYLPPFEKPAPAISVRRRIQVAAVDVLRQAGFPPEEADEHGTYRRSWEGWVVAVVILAAAALPLAALTFG